MHFVAHRMTAASFAALAALMLIVAGLVGGQQEVRAANASVSIVGLAYVPATTNVAVGDTVTWTNNEATAIQHTVTSDTGTDLNSALLNPTNTYAKTFTAAGTFAYHCNVHATMHGTVVVAAQATTTATSTTAATATPTTATTATPTTAATATPTTAATATPTTPPPTATSAPTQPANAPINLTLSGANEVPPVTTSATGKFLATSTASSLAFTLTASGTGFTQAHIHQGAAGTNGPIVAFLFGPVAAPGVSTINASGTITAANFVGPLAGKTMADFNAALAAGNLYVNAHTVANPGGEIRAQIPGTPAAPATGTGSVESGSDSTPFFLLAGLAAAAALASGGTAILRRRR